MYQNSAKEKNEDTLAGYGKSNVKGNIAKACQET